MLILAVLVSSFVFLRSLLFIRALSVVLVMARNAYGKSGIAPWSLLPLAGGDSCLNKQATEPPQQVSFGGVIEGQPEGISCLKLTFKNITKISSLLLCRAIEISVDCGILRD